MVLRMSAKGLLSIPRAIRRRFGMTAHTRIRMDVDEQNCRIVLTPITREHIQAWQGRYRGMGLLKALVADKKRQSGF